MTDQQQGERSADQPGDRPGRYQRTIAGGIGSMIVLVLVVLAFVVFRAVFRDNDAVEVDPVDYLSVVGPAQEAGVPVVYPPSLPDGWKATSVDFDPGDRPAWGVGMLTDDGKFVGVRQEDADLDSLLDTYVDEDATEGDTVTVEGPSSPSGRSGRTPAVTTRTPRRSATTRSSSTAPPTQTTCSRSSARSPTHR